MEIEYPSCPHCAEPEKPGHECTVEGLKARVEQMEEDRWEVQSQVNELNRRLDREHKRITELNQEIERQKKMRRTEREGLVEWLDRRTEQQEEAMKHSYISGETKRIMEIEIAMLRRYRGIVVDGGQRAEDPLMPRFE